MLINRIPRHAIIIKLISNIFFQFLVISKMYLYTYFNFIIVKEYFPRLEVRFC